MTTLSERCDKLAQQYPYAGDDIHSFYLLIVSYEDKYKMHKTTDEIFDIIQRVLDISCIHATNPRTIIRLVYSDAMANLFRMEE